MHTQTPRIGTRWVAMGRGRVEHDGSLLGAIGCVAAALLLYLMFALLLGSDDDYDGGGAFGRSPPPSAVVRLV